MSKEKQIEEMFNDVVEAEQRYHEYCLANICHACEYYGDGECDNHIRAEYLYNAGYRKQSEVIDEFAREMKEYLDDTYSTGEDALIDICDLIDHVAQKMKGGAE